MDTLRWILLIIGILVLVGIYVAGKRGEWLTRRHGNDADHHDPRFGEAGEEDWLDDVRPIRRDSADEDAPHPFIADRDDAPPARQVPPLEVDEPSIGAHEVPDLTASHREDVPDEDGWLEDVRPVRRSSADDAAQAPPFAAQRDEAPVPWQAPAATGGESSPEASQEREFAEPAFAAEADEDGWLDDVRPLKRDTSADAEQETQTEGRRDIPERVASTLSASVEEERRRAEAESERPLDVLIIHVVPDSSAGHFRGEDLGSAFEEFGLTFGPMGIYHREAGAGGGPMFSVVNRIKPGTFDPEHFADMETPGFSLFMQLPGPDQPMVAFRAMSDCARRLAERLGGRLHDEQSKPMTPQAHSRYEKRVRSYTSGLYRRLHEVAEPEVPERDTQPDTPAFHEESEPVAAWVEETPDRVDDAYAEDARPVRQSADSRQAPPAEDADAEDSSISARAGTATRKLLGRYEERVRSFVSGLSQRSQEPDDPEWDALMHGRDDPRDAGHAQRDIDPPDTSPETPVSAPAMAVHDDPIPVGQHAAAADVQPAAAEAGTQERRSTLERAASRNKAGKAHVEPEPGMPEELLIIHIIADPAVGTFGGDDIAAAFEACDLRFGAMQIYHREANSGTPMFSAINMIKPGTFNPASFSELQTPGVSLFMQLPGPDQPMVAFRAMSDCARRLVEHLGGRLQDETHSTLTTQTLTHYEERVRSFIQHQARLAGGRRV